MEGGAGCGVEIKGAFGRVKGGAAGEETLVLLGGFNTQKLVVEPTWESGRKGRKGGNSEQQQVERGERNVGTFFANSTRITHNAMAVV